MPGNRKLEWNGSTSDRVEEEMRRLKVEDNDADGGMGDELGSYPDRPGEPNCIYYLRTGTCGYGSNCRFNHPSNPAQVNGAKTTVDLPERAGQPDCVYYLKTGTCKYGSTCKYHHPKDRQDDSVMNMLGLPMRQNASPCVYYMRTGLCKYGNACKFHHPQPAIPTNYLPVAAPIYGSSGSGIVPSSGPSSATELSLSKATYYASSIQQPQSYMPYYLSLSQGWNTYSGGMNPLSATNAVATQAPNGQLSLPYLPERPDQPECRYFVEHGTCKYGSECKYHHPREKISHASDSLGPSGLPLRPGQPVCTYYNQLGICKYGPTCKFDHPFPMAMTMPLEGYGYPYPYNTSLPPLYAPVPPYTRTTSGGPVSDWIKNGAATPSNKDQQSKSIERSDSLPHSSEVSSEVIIGNESELYTMPETSIEVTAP